MPATEGLLRRARQTAGPVQRWKDTTAEDGGSEEVESLLKAMKWNTMVDTDRRDRLAGPLAAAVATALKGHADAEMVAAFEEAAEAVADGKKPVEAFEDVFLSYNADMDQALAEKVRDAVQTAMASTAAVLAQEDEAADADALAEQQKAAKAAAQQKAELELQAVKDAEEQATLDVQAVMLTFAGDPILKKLKLKAQEDRNLSLGPATAAQAQAAADLWTGTANRKQLTNFHTPGKHDEFVSKFRPPNIDVNRVLKCTVLGGKEIIVHISPDAALEKRMVAYHRNQISIDQKAQDRIIPASASEGWKPK